MRYSLIENGDSQFKGKSKEKRRRFADDESGRFSGKSDTPLKKTQRKYKIAKREADKQIKDWEKAYS
ncbi:CsbD family protein [Candidatus Methylomicrobium oryzae]|jgi:uncharacterized protein YjbJ (UPF0337 family)|uniref:CsbD family protein n=1 Tax=Candidatus Methylomicrobium oryzae TaxID=2802053 RepID=UPI0019210A7E|nr:CsbD family protein [Methylomicrobium sp. RS1]MBL1263081.1 CsbD family protein [Methylomicrobium sp. RS1]